MLRSILDDRFLLSPGSCVLFIIENSNHFALFVEETDQVRAVIFRGDMAPVSPSRASLADDRCIHQTKHIFKDKAEVKALFSNLALNRSDKLYRGITLTDMNKVNAFLNNFADNKIYAIDEIHSTVKSHYQSAFNEPLNLNVSLSFPLRLSNRNNEKTSTPAPQKPGFFAKLWNSIKALAVMLWSLITTCSLKRYREWQNKNQSLNKSSFSTTGLMSADFRFRLTKESENKEEPELARDDSSVIKRTPLLMEQAPKNSNGADASLQSSQSMRL